MSSDNFSLHPALARDCLVVGDFPLCRVLLMNNANFPWLILVPRRNDLRELFDLAHTDYNNVMQEVRNAAEQFAAFTDAYKMNVATLGNMVPQLHIHIIARFENDAAWPSPVWSSNAAAKPYPAGIDTDTLAEIRTALNITKM